MTRKCADQTDKKDWDALGNGALSSIWLVPGVTKRDETASQNMAQNLKSFACITENATFSRMNTTELQHTMLILGKGPVSICWDLQKLQLSQAHQQGEKNNYLNWQTSQDTCLGDLVLPSCAPPLKDSQDPVPVQSVPGWKPQICHFSHRPQAFYWVSKALGFLGLRALNFSWPACSCFTWLSCDSNFSNWPGVYRWFVLLLFIFCGIQL